MDLQPVVDSELRRIVLEWRLEFLSASELSDWLRDLKQPTQGSISDKMERIRAHSLLGTTPPESFRDDFLGELSDVGVEELASLCEELGLEAYGKKDSLKRRCYRELGVREGWLPRTTFPEDPTFEAVRRAADWYPVFVKSDYEKDHYDEFEDAMCEVFGDNNVHGQQPVALAGGLKIDFHIGNPSGAGVGVELKVPASTADAMKAVGQAALYAGAYGRDNVIVVILPQMLPDDRLLLLFQDKLRETGVVPIVKNT